jgi:hypothetical protein
MNGAKTFLPADANLDTTGLPAWGAILFNMLGVVVEVFFGIIGGVIGGAIFRTDRPAKNAQVQA